MSDHKKAQQAAVHRLGVSYDIEDSLGEASRIVKEVVATYLRIWLAHHMTLCEPGEFDEWDRGQHQLAKDLLAPFEEEQ